MRGLSAPLLVEPDVAVERRLRDLKPLAGLPGRDAAVFHQGLELRHMEGAAHLLNFKVTRSLREATAQFIDVDTGKIEKQQMTQGNGDDWLRDAIVDAWNQLTRFDHEWD